MGCMQYAELCPAPDWSHFIPFHEQVENEPCLSLTWLVFRHLFNWNCRICCHWLMVKSVMQSCYCFTIFYGPWNYPSSHYQNGDTWYQGIHNTSWWCWEWKWVPVFREGQREWWWLNSTSLRAQRPNPDWDFITASLFLLTCVHVCYVCSPHTHERNNVWVAGEIKPPELHPPKQPPACAV